MRFPVETEVDMNVEDVIEGMNGDEMEEMYKSLCDYLGKHEAYYEKIRIVDILRCLTPYQLKIVLCDALYIPSYVDSNALRNKLEDIITAK